MRGGSTSAPKGAEVTDKRLSEIRRRLQQIDAAHPGADLTPEARAEVETLDAEAARLHERAGEQR